MQGIFFGSSARSSSFCSASANTACLQCNKYSTRTKLNAMPLRHAHTKTCHNEYETLSWIVSAAIGTPWTHESCNFYPRRRHEQLNAELHAVLQQPAHHWQQRMHHVRVDSEDQAAVAAHAPRSPAPGASPNSCLACHCTHSSWWWCGRCTAARYSKLNGSAFRTSDLGGLRLPCDHT